MKHSTLFVLLLAACGGGGDKPAEPDAPILIDADLTVDAAPPREVVNGVQSLEAGELVESTMNGGTPGAGDRAIITLTAPTATLDWNIHAHPGGTTITVHEENDIMTTTFDFIPSENAEWFLLLRNGGGVAMDVQVKVELFGAMTFAF
jgi:hypothetical protein